MDWIQLSVYCPEDGIEQVSAMLSALGAEEQEIVDDMPTIRAHLQENQQYWDYIDEDALRVNRDKGSCIRVYVSSDPDGLEKKREIYSGLARLKTLGAEALGFEPSDLHVGEKVIQEEDWANVWRDFYHSMEIGQRLLVAPEWEDVDATEDRVVLRMEPGLVFGTGEHQTTQLCLTLIERHVQPGAKVLDLGCGSGILSVAALLLGASDAVGVDVDANARGVAMENAAKNGLDPARYQVLIGDILQAEDLQRSIKKEGPYGLVLSNIVADVVIALTRQVPDLLQEQGTWIASGIITERLEEVVAAMGERGFQVTERMQKDDW